MRKIKIKKWETTVPDTENPGQTRTEQMNTLRALNFLFNLTDRKAIPNGWDSARVFNRVMRALEKEKDGYTFVEEGDYSIVRDIVKKSTPGTWGLDRDMFEALDLFMEAESISEEEEPKKKE